MTQITKVSGNDGWLCKSFADLEPAELYAILQLRNEVFILEQNCAFQDLDNKDQASHHLMCWKDDMLAAYARLVPAEISYSNISIGRVVTASQFRKTGLGKELMTRAIHMVRELHGNNEIQIGAQLYLKRFYEGFGFQQSGPGYLEDGIDHIPMLLSAEKI